MFAEAIAPPESFWTDYARACSEAELFRLPAEAGPVAVVGPLAHAGVAVDRHRYGSDGATRPVFVHTADRTAVPRAWRRVDRPSDLVTALERHRGEDPILAIDVADEPPAWLRPLIGRLQVEGLDLVHCVMDRSDAGPGEIATWLGQAGERVVIDLAFPMEPRRIVDLIDRGEPLASIAGFPITGPLLLALRAATA